jgi:hypothetical protein
MILTPRSFELMMINILKLINFAVTEMEKLNLTKLEAQINSKKDENIKYYITILKEIENKGIFKR